MDKKTINKLKTQISIIKQRLDIWDKILQQEESKVEKKAHFIKSIECAICHCKNVRVRMDKTYFCRSCGFDSRKNKDSIKEVK